MNQFIDYLFSFWFFFIATHLQYVYKIEKSSAYRSEQDKH